MVAVGLWVEGETTIGQRLVVGGVAMEVVCAWWVLIASRKLQNILETGLETLRLEAANANARAAEAMLELSRIERRLELRSLTPQEQERIANKIVFWKVSQIAVVNARADDSEVQDFLTQLTRILAEAGWHPIVIKDTNVSRGLIGLLVIANEKAGPHVSENVLAARTLVEALSESGIFTQGPLSMPRPWPAPIHLVIVAKPNWAEPP